MKPSTREAQQGCGRNRWAEPECVRSEPGGGAGRGLLSEPEGEALRLNRLRRVTLPKPDGGERLLGIPTVRDRVCGTSTCVTAAGPIFDGDFHPSAMANRRPQRPSGDQQSGNWFIRRYKRTG